ncbi:HNH endonuclease signature motif containing protein [Nesterenkonia alkaliphila]|uniref:HNH endonuclease signature motif containing protein n=1 Tax=Nesterenkonia alkaliphila TaxID=1463631 RepID=UPI0039C11955
MRDGQCQTPGCTESGWSAEIDHKQSYETGGATTGQNLQTLCKNCHDIKSHKHHPPDQTRADPGDVEPWSFTQDPCEDKDPYISESDPGPPPDWAVDDAA